jgi:hypothetical protein
MYGCQIGSKYPIVYVRGCVTVQSDGTGLGARAGQPAAPAAEAGVSLEACVRGESHAEVRPGGTCSAPAQAAAASCQEVADLREALRAQAAALEEQRVRADAAEVRCRAF